MSRDPYFGRPEVSNSDLTELKKMFLPQKVVYDIEKAYKFGTLIDNMITEPEKVNYFKFQCQGLQYTPEDFHVAEEMKKAFYRDDFCRYMVSNCSFQKVSIRKRFPITYDGVTVHLPVRCKWDLFCESFDLSGDIKSTTATTMAQCQEALRYFDYDRSRSWYMDIEDRANDVVTFISKKNYKIFHIPFRRGSQLYKQGRAKYEELGFKYWSLFGEVDLQAVMNTI